LLDCLITIVLGCLITALELIEDMASIVLNIYLPQLPNVSGLKMLQTIFTYNMKGLYIKLINEKNAFDICH
jgi:hypothetical protein